MNMRKLAVILIITAIAAPVQAKVAVKTVAPVRTTLELYDRELVEESTGICTLEDASGSLTHSAFMADNLAIANAAGYIDQRVKHGKGTCSKSFRLTMGFRTLARFPISAFPKYGKYKAYFAVSRLPDATVQSTLTKMPAALAAEPAETKSDNFRYGWLGQMPVCGQTMVNNQTMRSVIVRLSVEDQDAKSVEGGCTPSFTDSHAFTRPLARPVGAMAADVTSLVEEAKKYKRKELIMVVESRPSPFAKQGWPTKNYTRMVYFTTPTIEVVADSCAWESFPVKAGTVCKMP